MSHEITSTDGLVLAGKPAWHGLGTVLPQAPTVKEAVQEAGMGWRMEEMPVYRMKAATIPPEYEPVPNYKELRRSDTGEPFAVVSKGYTLLQNESMAELIDALAADGCIPTAESAGSLKGGRRVFFLIQTGSFLAGPRDRVVDYLLFSNAHDGSAAFRVTPTQIRTVCHNTLSAALNRAVRDGTDLIRIPHTAGLVEAVEAAKPRILEALAAGAGLKAQVQALAAKRMPQDAVATYFQAVAAKLWPDRVKLAAAGDAAALDRMKAQIRLWIGNLLSPRNTDTGTEGTVWHALNAVTEWAEHQRVERAGGDRVYSRLFGGAADVKRAALELALEVV